MSGLVKICGLSTIETLEAALDSGADYIGLVRFAKSPRHVDLDTGKNLSRKARNRALRVVLCVDATDSELEEMIEALDPDILQLHGAETPERVSAIKARFGRPVMKAVGIGQRQDVAHVERYRSVSDHILIDAKPVGMEALPGGNGKLFDWTLLDGLDPALAFMVSGGLSAHNVAAAISTIGAQGVDVSSGVEIAPGQKDPAKIEAFVQAARAAFAADRKTELS